MNWKLEQFLLWISQTFIIIDKQFIGWEKFISYYHWPLKPKTTQLISVSYVKSTSYIDNSRCIKKTFFKQTIPVRSLY